MITSKTLFGSRNILNFIAVFAALVAINGCVALQPFPNAARSGDTITLAVGSADGMTADNTTVEFYSNASPSNAIPIPVIRSIFKVNPDKTSTAWIVDTHTIAERSSHGPWLSVIVVDLPALPDGDGFIRVTTNGEVVYPRFAATPNGTDIPITILPGTGNANPLDYAAIQGATLAGDLSALEAMPQVIIQPAVLPDGTATDVIYGAIEMNLTMPIITLEDPPATVLDEGIAVVLDDQPQNVFNQTQLLWDRDGDNMRIMLISPKGMSSHEARVSIVPRWPDYVYGVSGTPSLDSIVYYDLNGNLSSGPLPPLPTVTKIDSPYFP